MVPVLLYTSTDLEQDPCVGPGPAVRLHSRTAGPLRWSGVLLFASTDVDAACSGERLCVPGRCETLLYSAGCVLATPHQGKCMQGNGLCCEHGRPQVGLSTGPEMCLCRISFLIGTISHVQMHLDARRKPKWPLALMLCVGGSGFSSKCQRIKTQMNSANTGIHTRSATLNMEPITQPT